MVAFSQSLWQAHHLVVHIVCFAKQGQSFQPETGLFLFRVPELPRVDDLIRLTINR